MTKNNDATRRYYVGNLTHEELIIRGARISVEKMPADERLTDAVMLLGLAQEAVADYVDDKPFIKRTELLKSAQVDEDGLPCVSCGKPSQVATPDDADMCHECFGQFNATEYDLLKAQVDELVKALKYQECTQRAQAELLEQRNFRGQCNADTVALNLKLNAAHAAKALKQFSATEI